MQEFSLSFNWIDYVLMIYFSYSLYKSICTIFNNQINTGTYTWEDLNQKWKIIETNFRNLYTDSAITPSGVQVLPKIIELWGLNVQTDVESKKNFTQLTVRWPHHCFCFAAYNSASPSGILTYSQSEWWTICTQKAAMMSTKAMRKSLRRGISMHFSRIYVPYIMTACWH